MDALQAVAVFGGVPALVVVLVAAAVYGPSLPAERSVRRSGAGERANAAAGAHGRGAGTAGAGGRDGAAHPPSV